jgi:stage III sporulation protein AE
MRWGRFVVGILLVILLLGMGQTIALADNISDSSTIEFDDDSEIKSQDDSEIEDQDDTVKDLLEELPLDDLDEVFKAQTDTADISFSDILERLLTLDEEPDKKEIVSSLFKLAFGDVIAYKQMFVQLLLVTAAFAFLHHFIDLFENSQVSNMGFYLYFLMVMVLLMKSYALVQTILTDILAQMVNFMNALLPAFCMTMVFSAQQISAAGFYQLSLSAIYLVERVLGYVIVPGIHIYVILQMLNFLTDEKLMSKMTGLLRSVITWGMRVLLAGVTGMNMIEHMIAPSLDNLKKLTVTKTISMIPGLGNAAEAVGNVFLGSAVVIKNGMGAAALIGVIVVCIGPMLKMLVFTLLYKVAGAVVQPFSDKRICGCIDCVGEGASLLLRALVTGMLMFLITIAVVVTATR